MFEGKLKYYLLSVCFIFAAFAVLFKAFSSPVISDTPRLVNYTDSSSSAAGDSAPSEKAGDVINLNTCSYDELITLDGIGDVKARAILAYRAEVGGFNRIEEIMNINGIGEQIFEKIRTRITV